jgi:gamma-glutamyl-gamma-aminobutyrate hydrolase PuuD
MVFNFFLITLLLKIFLFNTKSLKFLYPNSDNDCRNMTIGIVANSNPVDGSVYPQARIDQNYVIWLEKSGAIVVPILPFLKDQELNLTLNKVNGVLLQGGDRYINPFDQFENFTLKILNFIIERNKNSDNKIAVWATCQGFELVSLLFSGSKFRDNVNLFGRSKGTSHTALKTIEFNKRTEWKLKEHLERLNLFEKFVTKHVNLQSHTTYVKISAFEFFPLLNARLEITSIQYDALGVPFIDSFQGNDLNLYGSQFHPEKAMNERSYRNVYRDDFEDAVSVSLGISDFFINEMARKSSYCLEDDPEPLKAVRENKNFYVCADVDFFYYFNNTNGNYTNSAGQKIIC